MSSLSALSALLRTKREDNPSTADSCGIIGFCSKPDCPTSTQIIMDAWFGVSLEGAVTAARLRTADLTQILAGLRRCCEEHPHLRHQGPNSFTICGIPGNFQIGFVVDLNGYSGSAASTQMDAVSWVNARLGPAVSAAVSASASSTSPDESMCESPMIIAIAASLPIVTCYCCGVEAQASTLLCASCSSTPCADSAACLLINSCAALSTADVKLSQDDVLRHLEVLRCAPHDVQHLFSAMVCSAITDACLRFEPIREAAGTWSVEMVMRLLLGSMRSVPVVAAAFRALRWIVGGETFATRCEPCILLAAGVCVCVCVCDLTAL